MNIFHISSRFICIYIARDFFFSAQGDRRGGSEESAEEMDPFLRRRDSGSLLRCLERF